MQTKICGSLCLLAAAALLPGVYAETPPEVLSAIPHTEELLNVVVVSRHGVRSPTQSPEKLHGWADKKWPAWPVAPGLLTPRGFYLVKATWELNRSRSPFTYGVCPKPEDVQIIADVDERTRKTAEALNEGLYPTCGYKVKVTSSARSAIFLR
ncbi:MAG: histidine-type phosphatase [Parasutterella sp.]